MRVIGVDVGGTFTDVVFVDTETDQIVIYNLPTSAHDPSTGVLTGIRVVPLSSYRSSER